ncbi:MAG: glycosyltransferase, partial [Bacteroidota bacterium]
FWIRPSVRFLNSYLRENHVDAVITTGPPHSMHLIGLGLKKRRNIFWVADFRDPWTGIDFYHRLKLSKWADQKHHRLENMVLRHADQVVAVGQLMAEELRFLGARSCVTIPNGYDPEDFSEVQKIEPEKRFSILHLGAINKDRNHEVFYRVLSQLIEDSPDFRKGLHLKFIGKNDHAVQEAIEKWGLSDNTEFVSYIPHSDIQEALSCSQILYLPLNNTPNAKSILTGKIFEYLASGKPILGIGPEDGEAARIIQETGSGHMVGFDNDLALREIITGWFDQYRQGILKSDQHGVEKYSRRALTSELAAIMKR